MLNIRFATILSQKADVLLSRSQHKQVNLLLVVIVTRQQSHASKVSSLSKSVRLALLCCFSYTYVILFAHIRHLYTYVILFAHIRQPQGSQFMQIGRVGWIPKNFTLN